MPKAEPERVAVNRRRTVYAGVGAAALAAGAGLALWRRGAPADRDGPIDLWSLRLERPEGGELSIGALRGRTLLLNFWATWCAPCVREMPLLDRFCREQGAGGWQVVGLAIDQKEAVKRFLATTAVRYPIGMASAVGLRLVRALGNDAGGLPYTVVLDTDGKLLHRRLGALEPGELQAWSQRLG